MKYSTTRYLTNHEGALTTGRAVLSVVMLIVLAGWLSLARAQDDGNGVLVTGSVIRKPDRLDTPVLSVNELTTQTGQPPMFGFNVVTDGNEWCTFGPTLPLTFLLPAAPTQEQPMPWDPAPMSPNPAPVPPNSTVTNDVRVEEGVPGPRMSYGEMHRRGLVPPLPDFLPARGPIPLSSVDGEPVGLTPGDVEFTQPAMAGANDRVVVAGSEGDDEEEPGGLTPSDVEFTQPAMAGTNDRVIVAGSEGDDEEEEPGGLNPSDVEFTQPAMGNATDRVIVGGPDGDDDVVPENTGIEDAGSSIATAGVFNIFIKAKKTVLESDGTEAEQLVAAQPFKIIFPAGALPADAAEKPQDGFDEDPVQGVTGDDGRVGFEVRLDGRMGISVEEALRIMRETDSIVKARSLEYGVEIDPIKSFVLEGDSGRPLDEFLAEFPTDFAPYMHQGQVIGDIPFITLTYPESSTPVVDPVLQSLSDADWLIIQENFCRTKQAPNDPSFVQTASRGKSGSWGQPYDDQWAIKRVGLTAEENSAWNNLGENPQSVVVAVIDTGLDWNHLDISWDNIWKNEIEIPNNQIDDDGNGYIDDVIGWDFMGASNLPWDYDGHGTIVSGIISATQNNDVGIAGINPYSKLMVLKALNAFGNTRASYIAESIVYAADNGARLINISVGGEKLSRIERAAVDYASEKGVLIIAAAGNEGQSLEDYGPAGIDGVLTVAATDLQDARTIFSNWGQQVDIAAPGIDVLSLRARRTDTMLDIPDVEYVRAANYVGDDKRYYRVSGTSFAAPIVTGIASLVLSKQPDLSHEELHRIITQSADDADIPGKDQFTGYGIVNASAALSLDRDYYIDSLISGASVVQQDGTVLLAVAGTANANDFESAWIEIGAGSEPTEWKRVATDIEAPVIDGTLGMIPATEFAGSSEWVLRLVTEHDDGTRREAWFLLSLG